MNPKNLMVLLTFILSQATLAVEMKPIVWTGIAPQIEIPVGIERVIKFQHNKIQVGVPMEHMGITSAESNNGVVYLRSRMPFAQTRYRFREKDTGKIFLIDITAKEGIGQQPPVLLLTEKEPSVDPAGQVGTSVPMVSITDDDAATADQSAPAVAPIRHGVTVLVRYAMQNVYAPDRLIKPIADVHRIAFRASDTNIKVVPGANVRARVLGKWRNQELYVTALYLQNMSADTVDLDPRYLHGRHSWKASALMNTRLSAANSFGDATTLVTISTFKSLQGPL